MVMVSVMIWSLSEVSVASLFLRRIDRYVGICMHLMSFTSSCEFKYVIISCLIRCSFFCIEVMLEVRLCTLYP